MSPACHVDILITILVLGPRTWSEVCGQKHLQGLHIVHVTDALTAIEASNCHYQQSYAAAESRNRTCM